MNEMIPLTVANTLNQTAKNRIEAKAGQSLKQAIQNQNLAPKGQFDVYDQNGKVVSNEGVSNLGSNGLCRCCKGCWRRHPT